MFALVLNQKILLVKQIEKNINSQFKFFFLILVAFIFTMSHIVNSLAFFSWNDFTFNFTEDTLNFQGKLWFEEGQEMAETMWRKISDNENSKKKKKEKLIEHLHLDHCFWKAQLTSLIDN